MSIRGTIWSDDVLHVWYHTGRGVVVVDAHIYNDKPKDAWGYGNEVKPFEGGGEVQVELPEVAVKDFLAHFARFPAFADAKDAEIRRLRDLVRSAERKGRHFANGACPWCHSDGAHFTLCPAFTSDGQVK